MAIYSDKTNLIDKVVVTNGGAPEEMDFVYVTNASGKRELVFEKKAPPPDDNTQPEPPKMRRWSAHLRGDITGLLFSGGLKSHRYTNTVILRTRSALSMGPQFINRQVPEYVSKAYRQEAHLRFIADGNGGYTFEPRNKVGGNGWRKLDGYLRNPTASELTWFPRTTPYTGSLPMFPLPHVVSGLPLSNVFNVDEGDIYVPTTSNDVRRTSSTNLAVKVRGATSLVIKPTTPNGTYTATMEIKGRLGNFGDYSCTLVVTFVRTSTYDNISVRATTNTAGTSNTNTYTMRVNKSVVAKEEPNITSLVTHSSNILRGIGGNPKAFRMGDGVTFTSQVNGVYI